MRLTRHPSRSGAQCADPIARLAELGTLSGAELRALRRRHGLSQAAFGALVGLTQSRLTDLEKGWDRKLKTPIAVPRALALAARLIERELPEAAPPQPGTPRRPMSPARADRSV